VYEATYPVVVECEMKINSPQDIPAALSSQAQPASFKTGQAPIAKASQGQVAMVTKEAASVGVAVTVSTLARSLEVSGSSEPADVDTEKVNAIRAKIEDGTYTVNAEAIADKLLSNAQEMLNSKRN
jgi:negative regulator of flagellin synthesis FlgM